MREHQMLVPRIRSEKITFVIDDYRWETQAFTRLVTVSKSGGASPDRKRRTKTYQQVYFKRVRVPL